MTHHGPDRGVVRWPGRGSSGRHPQVGCYHSRRSTYCKPTEPCPHGGKIGSGNQGRGSGPTSTIPLGTRRIRVSQTATWEDASARAVVRAALFPKQQLFLGHCRLPMRWTRRKRETDPYCRDYARGREGGSSASWVSAGRVSENRPCPRGSHTDS